MELPFLKNKKNSGGGTATATVQVAKTSDGTSDQVLLEGIADELLSAIEKKDIKRLRESLQALVLNIRRQDET